MTQNLPHVNCRDLTALNAEAGRQFKVVAPSVRPEDVALQGRFRLMRLRSGLSMHSTDATDLHDLVTQVVSDPGLTISLFLQGQADISLGGRRFAVAVGETRGFMLNCAEPDLFERRGIRGNTVRKVNVSVPPEWFDGQAMGHIADPARNMARTHVASTHWVPSARQIQLAERLIQSEAGNSLLEDLYVESHALELVAEALRLLSGTDERGEDSRLNPRERARLRAACDYLDAQDEGGLRLDDVAREAGMSASALQRLFHNAFGMSVFEYARDRKMERAREMLEREGISVTEAAYLSGFNSPANFATAFKRKFGISPREARLKGYC